MLHELIEAVKYNDLRRVEDLLNSGSDIHYNGDEALRIAVSLGNYEMVKFLLSKKANADMVNLNVDIKFLEGFGFNNIITIILEHQTGN